MQVDQASDMVREMLVLMMAVSSPILLAALVVGLSISILQAVTQVQEQTLTFVPKILAMAGVTVVAAPWLLQQVMDFSTRMFAGG